MNTSAHITLYQGRGKSHTEFVDFILKKLDTVFVDSFYF